ncbi:amidohydrolase family protein [Jonesia quinghaiensis]|uniref:amidohydrolase family protein n=1 Tax=Jonesia quinghaiensis TaxID=262806 RepID=UPI00040C5513|nr:amidohydrolase family protein [Jonesia quinghaiensis]
MTQSQRWRLRGRIILDDGSERPEAWVVGGKLSLTAVSGDVTTLDGVFLPGLVDMHCHIGLDAHGATTPEIAYQQAVVNRDSGVLLVRDAGSALDTSWLQSRTDVPHIIRCGQHIARPRRYLKDFASEIDQSDQLPAEMDRQARRGDGWVKIVADWIEREHGDLAPLWRPQDLAAGVARAHAAGARVTAHTFATESVGALLDAGIDCLEHGTGMSEEHMRRAAEAGIPVVPTLLQIERFDQIAAQGEHRFPDFALRMRRMHAQRREQVHALHALGVSLFVGTDAGGSIAHGRIADECAALVEAGIPSEQVTASASWQSRQYLGRPGMREGEVVQAVRYADDPHLDITALRSPTTIITHGVLQLV